jgi:hypothetical protein
MATRETIKKKLLDKERNKEKTKATTDNEGVMTLDLQERQIVVGGSQLCCKEDNTNTKGDDKPNEKDMATIWETKVFLD